MTACDTSMCYSIGHGALACDCIWELTVKHNRGSRGLSRFPRDWTCHQISHLVMTVPGLVRKMKTRDCKYLFRTVVRSCRGEGCSENRGRRTGTATACFEGTPSACIIDFHWTASRPPRRCYPTSFPWCACGCGSVPVSAFSVSLLGRGDAIALAVLALACQDDVDDEERTRTSGPRRLLSSFVLSVDGRSPSCSSGISDFPA